jgi:protein subunit release factor A
VDVFKFISQKIPHHIVFILQYGDSYRLLIQYGQDSFVSSWCKLEELSLKIEGQTLDRIYDGFVGQLTGIGNRDSESLQEIIRLKKEIKKLSEKIETMQRQIRKEPQLNRQIEMNSEARAMKQQLGELKDQLNMIL